MCMLSPCIALFRRNSIVLHCFGPCWTGSCSTQRVLDLKLILSFTSYIITSNCIWPQRPPLLFPPLLKLPTTPCQVCLYQTYYHALETDERARTLYSPRAESPLPTYSRNFKLHAQLRHFWAAPLNLVGLKSERSQIRACSSRWAHQQQDLHHQTLATLRLKIAALGKKKLHKHMTYFMLT